METVDGDPESKQRVKNNILNVSLVYVQAMTNIIEERIAKLTTFRGTFVKIILLMYLCP